MAYFVVYLVNFVLLMYLNLFANRSLIRNKNVLHSALLPKIDIKIIHYILLFLLYLLYNIFFMDVVYAMEPGMGIEEIRSTIEFFQDEVVSIQSMLSDQGLNVDNSMLNPEQQKSKTELLDALKDTKEALSSNISKLRDAKLADTSEVLGKRVAESQYGNASRKR